MIVVSVAATDGDILYDVFEMPRLNLQTRPWRVPRRIDEHTVFKQRIYRAEHRDTLPIVVVRVHAADDDPVALNLDSIAARRTDLTAFDRDVATWPTRWDISMPGSVSCIHVAADPKRVAPLGWLVDRRIRIVIFPHAESGAVCDHGDVVYIPNVDETVRDPVVRPSLRLNVNTGTENDCCVIPKQIEGPDNPRPPVWQWQHVDNRSSAAEHGLELGCAVAVVCTPWSGDMLQRVHAADDGSFAGDAGNQHKDARVQQRQHALLSGGCRPLHHSRDRVRRGRVRRPARIASRSHDGARARGAGGCWVDWGALLVSSGSIALIDIEN